MPLNGNSSRPRRWPITTIVVVAAVGLLAAFVTRRDESIPIRTATVERGKIRSLIATNGKIEPVHNFEAHARIAASVERVLVKEGEEVHKGQLLVVLDDVNARSEAAHAVTQLKDAQAQLSASERGGTQEEMLNLDAQITKARTDRDAAQRNLDALKKLQQEGAASAGEVKDAQDTLTRADSQLTLLKDKQTKRYSPGEIARIEAQKDEAQAVYEATQDNLSKANVRAPFDGIVYSLPVKQGGFVAGGDLLLQLADLKTVMVRAYVDEPDVAKLAIGDPIQITWDAMPNRTWQAAVNGIPSTVIVHSSRNVGEITSVVDNKDLKLLPNVNVSVTITSAEHDNVLVIPREALRTDDTNSYVLQVVDRKLKRQNVETSISNLTQVEIKQGVSANDVIAINSTNGKPIGEGTQVRF